MQPDGFDILHMPLWINRTLTRQWRHYAVQQGANRDAVQHQVVQMAVDLRSTKLSIVKLSIEVEIEKVKASAEGDDVLCLFISTSPSLSPGRLKDLWLRRGGDLN